MIPFEAPVGPASPASATNSRIAARQASGPLADQEVTAAGDRPERAPRRRAYSIPSSSLTQLSLAPHRQRHGHATRSSSVARIGAEERAAGLTRLGVDARGRRRTPRPGRARARRDRPRPTSRTPPVGRAASSPSLADTARSPCRARRRRAPSSVTRPQPRRRADARCRREDDAAHRVGTQHRRAQRDRRRRASDRPTPRRRPLRVGDREDGLGQARRRRAPQVAAPECPWPGRSGTRTRCFARERRARERASSRSSRPARARARAVAPLPGQPHSEAARPRHSSSRSSNP